MHKSRRTSYLMFHIYNKSTDFAETSYWCHYIHELTKLFGVLIGPVENRTLWSSRKYL